VLKKAESDALGLASPGPYEPSKEGIVRKKNGGVVKRLVKYTNKESKKRRSSKKRNGTGARQPPGAEIVSPGGTKGEMATGGRIWR